MKKVVGIPRRKTFRNITTDRQKVIILSVVSLAMLPLGLLAIFVFNIRFFKNRIKE